MAEPGSVPELEYLRTLEHPATGASRSWQSKPHPDPSIPLLATASADKSVNIWSLKDFSLVSTISGGHKRSVRTVAWKDFGKRIPGKRKHPVVLGTGSFDANVGIWLWNDERRNQYDGEASTEQVNSEDSLEKDMTEEDDEEWHFSTLLTGPDSEIKSIAFSPAQGYPGSLLATSSRDKSVWVWEEVEPEEWETIAVLSEHTGDVKCVSWCEGAKRRKRRKLNADVEMANGDSNTETVPDDHEDVILGCRPLLASGSYDDTIRLWRDVEEEGDWICVGVISQHGGTVWDVKFETHINYSLLDTSQHETTEKRDHALDEFEADWQPRLLSCSDDLTVRIWRRAISSHELAKRRAQTSDSMTAPPTGFAGRIPNVIRPMSSTENWEEEATLPIIHVRSIYAVDWSARTGLVVSCGGEGTIVVYREVPNPAPTDATNEDVTMNGDISTTASTADEAYKLHKSTWEIVAVIEAAHDEYEVNHVCWAERRDKDKRFEGEEVIVSTGDEGDVRIWTLPDPVVSMIDRTS
jgi:cytosolic iron-sulfur protein assembly protein CIAO1